MKTQALSSFSNFLNSRISKNAEPSQSFEEILKAQENKEKSVKKSQKEAIEKFKNELFSYGPAGMAYKLNMDKIAEKLEKKRAELEGMYDIKNLSGDELKSALKAIEEAMMAYAKELREQTKATSELEKQNKKLLD